MLMVLTSTAGLALKPDDKSWIASGFIMVLWVLFFMALIWAVLFIVKKRLPAQMATRWFSTMSKEEKKGFEILSLSSLAPRTKAYHIRVHSQEFLIVDNLQSLVIQPIESEVVSGREEQQPS